MATDLELCKNKNYFEVWTRYRNLYYKVWDSLSPSMKLIVWPEEADFFSFCYEKTVMAVNSIKPEKVKNSDTWTIYIQLYRYIKTYAKREIEKEYKQNVCSLDSFIEDHGFDENAALKTEDQHEVDMDIFTLDEKELIEFLQSGHKWKEKYSKSRYYELRKNITSKLLQQVP